MSFLWKDVLETAFRREEMTKQGEKVKSWKRRCFVVYVHYLLYYVPNPKDSAKPKGVLDLRKVPNPSQIQPVVADAKNHCFVVPFKYGETERLLYIRARSRDAMDVWIRCLRTIVYCFCSEEAHQYHPFELDRRMSKLESLIGQLTDRRWTLVETPTADPEANYAWVEEMRTKWVEFSSTKRILKDWRDWVRCMYYMGYREERIREIYQLIEQFFDEDAGVEQRLRGAERNALELWEKSIKRNMRRLPPLSELNSMCEYQLWRVKEEEEEWLGFLRSASRLMQLYDSYLNEFFKKKSQYRQAIESTKGILAYFESLPSSQEVQLDMFGAFSGGRVTAEPAPDEISREWIYHADGWFAPMNTEETTAYFGTRWLCTAMQVRSEGCFRVVTWNGALWTWKLGDSAQDYLRIRWDKSRNCFVPHYQGIVKQELPNSWEWDGERLIEASSANRTWVVQGSVPAAVVLLLAVEPFVRDVLKQYWASSHAT